MKRFLISMAVVSLLWVGCGDTKKPAPEKEGGDKAPVAAPEKAK